MPLEPNQRVHLANQFYDAATTRVTDDLYSMVIEVALPLGLSGADLDQRLAATASALGVECTLHPSEADIL